MEKFYTDWLWYRYSTHWDGYFTIIIQCVIGYISLSGANIDFDMIRYTICIPKTNLHFDGLVSSVSRFRSLSSSLVSAVQKAIFDPSIYNLLIIITKTKPANNTKLQTTSFSFQCCVCLFHENWTRTKVESFCQFQCNNNNNDGNITACSITTIVHQKLCKWI